MSEESIYNKAKVKVKILNEEYVIKGDEPADYIENIASFVNEHFREIKEMDSCMSRNRIMILGSMNLADKLCKVQEAYENLEEEHTNLKNDYQEMKSNYKQLKSDYKKLQQEYNEFLDLVEEGEIS